MNMEIDQKVSDLINGLGSEDPLARHQARLALVNLGDVSVPVLLNVLESENARERREAVHALGDLHNPKVASALSSMLMDEDFSVRWAAMESLTDQGRGALRPMLKVFTKHFDSLWMREGVHHVLHVFKDYHQLHDPEIELFDLLDKQTIPGLENSWNGKAAWAAERALEALNRE